MRYEGRVVVITGANQGLGHAMAERFSAEGATVAACDVNVAPDAATLSEQDRGRIDISTVDVADPGAVNSWIADIHTPCASSRRTATPATHRPKTRSNAFHQTLKKWLGGGHALAPPVRVRVRCAATA